MRCMIPTPEFYVFYNGKKDYPVQQELSLSDAFMIEPRNNSMELKVTVININTDKAHVILDKCKILRVYSQFINTVRDHTDEEDAIRKAIEECIDKGILAEYLKRKGSEVRNMLIAEYSYEEDIKGKQEEAMQEGLSRGLSQGLSQGIEQMVVNALTNTKSIKQTALLLSLDEQMVKDIAKAKNMTIDN